MRNLSEETSRIVVDDVRMVTTCPDIFDVGSSREEITLFFGSLRSFDSDRNRITAMLSSRVILSPVIAKQIAALLDKRISEYESTFGVIKPEEPLHFSASRSSVLYVPDPDNSNDDGAEKAIRLMRLVDGLNTDYAYERSCKLARGSVLQNRFLFGINKNSLGANAGETLLSACRELEMPSRFLQVFRDRLHLAKCVHFGFEENSGGSLYKVYLEFDTEPESAAEGPRKPEEPFLLHLGFKWSTTDNEKCALSRYTCYPLLSTESVLERIGNIYRDSHHRKALQFATDIINTAVFRMPRHKFLYIEVSEEGNPRMSFDIKLYEANLLMREITPLMGDILNFYEIPAERFNTINDPFREKTFGHLSGGIDRNGQDFITIYFGVEWR